MQEISAAVALLFSFAFLVCMVVGIHFYRRKLDEMLELVRQPKDPMRSKGAFSLHELLRICTMTAIWLAFPNAKGPVGRKNAAMFSHLDASRFPGDIKGPLLTIYGAWFIGVVLLTANYVLMVLDS